MQPGANGCIHWAGEVNAPGLPFEPDIPRVACGIAFEGPVAGQLQLEFELEFAGRCLRPMQGPPLAGVPDETLVNARIAEITGLTAAHFAARLNHGAPVGRLGPPLIVRGHTIRVEPISAARRFRSEFISGADRVIAEVFIQDRPERDA